MRRLPVYLFVLALVLFAFSRCAQIVAPTGGPKDTIPPYLVSAAPPDSSLHFKSKQIVLDFDEFIQLQDLQKQMIIAPNPKRQPRIRVKLRTLTIEWNDTLKPNTTYTINMGNAIEDIDEGNPIKGFRYVFSTGDYLDSLEIGGRILDAQTGLPDSLMAVMLYTTLEDSVVTKEKPVYYTRTLGDGSFLFRNLPHGTFKLFALKDANGDLEYNDTTEAIAFVADPMKVDSNIQGVVLYDFLEKENLPAPAKAAPPAASKGKEKEKKPKLTVHLQLNNGKQDLQQPLVLTFGTPLKTIDSSKISLQEDTLHRPVPFGFAEDTTRKAVRLSYQWKEETPYRLLLAADFAADTGGVTLEKADTLQFTTKSLSDYGSLTLHFTTSDTSGLYVVQLFSGEDMIRSSPLKGNLWKTGYLDPGDYTVRILKDDNRNGRWDRGCYYCTQKRQPEEEYSLTRKFSVKANWDNDFTDLSFGFGAKAVQLLMAPVTKGR
jgi:uncharacterized protein (DUF2141 family)